MTTLLIANIGNRDVLLEGDASSPYPPRPKGAELLQRYSEIQERLTFPILDPCLWFVMEQLEAQQLSRLILIGTDQPEDSAAAKPGRNGIPFRDKDTVNFARLIDRCYKDRHKDKIGKIETRVVRGNPALYDEMMEEYANLVRKMASPDVTTCYVVSTGGTAACNTALLFQAVRYFADRCCPIYQPEEGEPYQLQTLGDQLLDTYLEETIRAYLERRDFAAALPLLRRLKASDALVALAEYAEKRLNFDFDTAQKRLSDGLARSTGARREFLSGLRHDLDALRQRAPSALLRELFHNARITYDQGRYVDFLGRAFRLEEGLARFLVEREYRIGTDSTADQNRFMRMVEENPDLAAFLRVPERGRGGKPLDVSKMSIPVWLAMIERLAVEGKARDADEVRPADECEKYRCIHAALSHIESLSDLRNRSIIAHDYEPVSRGAILQVYGPDAPADAPLQDMEAALQSAGVDVGADPFEKIAAFLCEALRRNDFR